MAALTAANWSVHAGLVTGVDREPGPAPRPSEAR